MGMTFDERPNTPASMMMRWSASVYDVDCHRIQTTINHNSAIATAARVTMVRKCGMPVPALTVKSTMAAMTRRTTGISSALTSTIQC